MPLIKFILPIAVYFVAEWIWTPLVAAAVAAGISLVQLVGERIMQKHLNTSYLYDILIISIFGAIEYFAEGEAEWLIWVVGALTMSALIFASLHSSFSLWGSASDVILSKLKRNPYSWYLFEKSMRRMAWCCIAAALLALVPAVFPQTEVSLWLSKYMIVLFLLLYVAVEVLANSFLRRKYSKEEWVPLLNSEAKVVGVAPRPLVHNGSRWLHPVVHLHVFSQGKLLLQLRPHTKKIQPNRWDTAVGGHISAREKMEDALRRETREEIGLVDFSARYARKYIWQSEIENEYVFCFRAENDGPFHPQNSGEVAELRLWSKSEILAKMGKGFFTPNLEHELNEWLLSDTAFRE